MKRPRYEFRAWLELRPDLDDPDLPDWLRRFAGYQGWFRLVVFEGARWWQPTRAHGWDPRHFVPGRILHRVPGRDYGRGLARRRNRARQGGHSSRPQGQSTGAQMKGMTHLQSGGMGSKSGGKGGPGAGSASTPSTKGAPKNIGANNKSMASHSRGAKQTLKAGGKKSAC